MKLMKAVSVALFMTALISGAASAEERLRLSSSTGTGKTGLLPYLIQAFEQQTGIAVDAVAQGADKSFHLAENGAVDVILVHSPIREKVLVEAGHGVNRRAVMANYYVILGPPADPARLVSAQNAGEAFNLIASSASPFVSRGDGSGTHEKEQSLWKEAIGIVPQNKPWYMEAGTDMEGTIAFADRKGAYTLSDSGTFQIVAEGVQLKILFRKPSQVLYNLYSAIAVNPARHPQVNYLGAMRFIAFLTSPGGQDLIGEYTDRSGNRPFIPLRGRE